MYVKKMFTVQLGTFKEEIVEVMPLQKINMLRSAKINHVIAPKLSNFLKFMLYL